MSFETIRVGASSLYAAQRATEIAAHNVANANTPGYTRQRLNVTSAVPTAGTPGMRGDGMRGNGVAVVGIDRLRDLLADLSYRAEAGTSGAADARASLLDRAQGVLGTVKDGASSALDRFYASWQTLSQKPDDAAARLLVVDSGKQIAGALNYAGGQLQQLREDISQRMDESTREVNSLAEHVATLNQAVSDAVTAGQAPNDLMDQRDLALDRLSALTGATARAGNNSQIDVYIGGSALVLGVNPRSVERTSNSTGLGVAFTGTGGQESVAVGGELGAQVRITTVDLPAYGEQLDTIARTLASTVNAIHSQAYSLNATPPPVTDPPTAAGPPDGGDFFTVMDGMADPITATNIQVRTGMTGDDVAVSATGYRSDGSVGLSIASLNTSTPGSTGNLLRGAISGMGAAAADAQRSADSAASGLLGADQRRSSATGVNVDEEMVDLVKYQHAYEAAARVVSVADEFLDVIINRLGSGR